MADQFGPTIVTQNYLGTLTSGGMTHSLRNHSRIYESGVTYSAADGLRTIYSASQSGVTYLQVTANAGLGRQKGAFYVQPFMGFDRDVSDFSGAAADLRVKLAATKSVMSDWLDLYKGVLSVAGGPLAISITGMDMIVTAGHIKRNYETYRDAAIELVAARRFCMDRMPVFYRTVLEHLFFGAVQDKINGTMQDMLIEGAAGKKYKLAGEIVGVFVGKARGEGQFKKNLGIVKELLNEVVLKVADHIAEKGGSLSEQQVEDLASRHVCRILGPSGIYVSVSDAKTIIRETEACAVSIRTMFRRLVKAIEISG